MALAAVQASTVNSQGFILTYVLPGAAQFSPPGMDRPATANLAVRPYCGLDPSPLPKMLTVSEAAVSIAGANKGQPSPVCSKDERE